MARTRTNRAYDAASRNDKPIPTTEDPPTPVDLPLVTRPMTTTRTPAPIDRDAAPPPDGYRYTMDGRLVPVEEHRLDISNPEAQEIFCRVLEVTGSIRAGCDALGIKMPLTVKKRMEIDLDFAEAAEAAADRHRQKIYAAAVQRATVGYEVPIIGGKEKDQIVAHERRYSDSILALLLKRHFPEFRDTKPVATTQVTINTVPPMRQVPRAARDDMRRLIQASQIPTHDPSGIDNDPIDATSTEKKE